MAGRRLGREAEQPPRLCFQKEHRGAESCSQTGLLTAYCHGSLVEIQQVVPSDETVGITQSSLGLQFTGLPRTGTHRHRA